MVDSGSRQFMYSSFFYLSISAKPIKVIPPPPCPKQFQEEHLAVLLASTSDMPESRLSVILPAKLREEEDEEGWFDLKWLIVIDWIAFELSSLTFAL